MPDADQEMTQVQQYWDPDVECVRWDCPDCHRSTAASLRECVRCGYVRNL